MDSTATAYQVLLTLSILFLQLTKENINISIDGKALHGYIHSAKEECGDGQKEVAR